MKKSFILSLTAIAIATGFNTADRQARDPRFVHRIQGGTVTAKRAKNIAIPQTAEAYAASGKGSIKESMPGLKVVLFKRGVFLCRESEEFRGGRRSGIKRLRIIPLFKLVKSVTHKPKPQEAPDETALRIAGETAMEKAANILLRS